MAGMTQQQKDMVTDIADVITIAILAERKRCADVARTWVSVANSVLNSGDGFSEAHWNGRLFAAEHIAAEIEAGT